MQSTDILNLAKSLYSQVDPEDRAMINNIISRAYYSCFHKAKDVAKDKYGWKEALNINGGVHEKLISRFDHHNFTEPSKLKLLAQIKSDLIRLKKKRVSADYNFNIILTKLDSGYCIKTAEQVCTRLNEL